MSSSKPTLSASTVPRALQVFVVVALVLGFLFVQPYISAVLFSALIAFVFDPVYKAVLRRTKRQGIAIAATLVTAALSVVIPCVFIVSVTVTQVNLMIENYENGEASIGEVDLDEVIDRGVERVDSLITALPGGEDLDIDEEELKVQAKGAISEGLKVVAKALADLGTAFFGLISTFILSIFLIMGMLRHQDALIGLLKRISPFDDEMNDHYLKRVSLMTTAMVKGQFIIAATQGFVSTISLWLVGLDYFWFLFMILSFLSFIPLGGGILTIPIGIGFILTGNIWQGVFLILWHMFVVSTIDNVLRPRLVGKDARLDTALMMLAVFSGLAIFGGLGVVFGPVIMILIVTTIQIYAEYNQRTHRVALPSSNSKA